MVVLRPVGNADVILHFLSHRQEIYRRVAVAALHLSFVVILIGALTTRLTSAEGTVHLRIGEDVTAYMDKDSVEHQLPFTMRLTDFQIQYYPGTDGIMDYKAEINVEKSDETAKISVSMNNIGKAEGKSLKWYTPGSTELPRGVGGEEFQFINHAMDYLVKYILANDIEGAKGIISKIGLYQKDKAGKVLPSAFKIKMEIAYNSLHSARWVTFLCLALAFAFCFLSFRKAKSKWLARLSTYYIIGQTAFLTVMLALRWSVSGHIPLSNGYETMLFMAWTVLVMTLAVMRKAPIFKAFGPIVSSLCMLVATLATGSPQVTPLMPVLQSPLLSVHVALVMMAYSLFAVVALIAMRSIWLCRQGGSMEYERLTALSRLLLYPAVALLAGGIFIGAVWANVSWGTYWSWDPKETWALITLLVYAIPLHETPLDSPAHPQRYHLYVLSAFLTILMTYFGVNYFLVGMHSYVG